MKKIYVITVLIAASGLFCGHATASLDWKRAQAKQAAEAEKAQESEEAKKVWVVIGDQRTGGTSLIEQRKKELIEGVDYYTAKDKEMLEQKKTPGVRIISTAVPYKTAPPEGARPKLPPTTLPPGDLPAKLPEEYEKITTQPTRTPPARPTTPLPKAFDIDPKRQLAQDIDELKESTFSKDIEAAREIESIEAKRVTGFEKSQKEIDAFLGKEFDKDDPRYLQQLDIKIDALKKKPSKTEEDLKKLGEYNAELSKAIEAKADPRNKLKKAQEKLNELNTDYQTQRELYEEKHFAKASLDDKYNKIRDRIKKLETSKLPFKDTRIKRLRKAAETVTAQIKDIQGKIIEDGRRLGEIRRLQQNANQELEDLKKQTSAETMAARKSIGPKPLPKRPSLPKPISPKEIELVEMGEARIEEFTEVEKTKEKQEDVLEKSKVDEAKEEELKGPPPPPSDAVVLTRSVVEKQIAALENKDVRERTPQEQQQLNTLKQTLGGFLTPEERKKAQEAAELEEYWKGPSDVKTKEQQERGLEQLGKLIKKPEAEKSKAVSPPPPAPPMLVSPAKPKTVAPSVVKKQTTQDSGDVMEQIKAGVQLKKVEKTAETPVQATGVSGALGTAVDKFKREAKGSSEEPVGGQDLRAAEEWD